MCPSCHLAKLKLRQDNEKRQGLNETLIVHCLICKNNVYTFETSENVQTEKGNKMKDINLCSAAATTSMGGALQSFIDCIMTLTYQSWLTKSLIWNYLSYLKARAVENCERSLRAAANELRKLKLECEEDVSQALDVVVSGDTAWQKIYGFNSLNDVIFVISIGTGCFELFRLCIRDLEKKYDSD